jgi:hypothetical protein
MEASGARKIYWNAPGFNYEQIKFTAKNKVAPLIN